MNLILASNSPRRKEILIKHGYEFKVIPSDYDEKISDSPYSSAIVKNCAYNKALSVFKKINEEAVIIASDTVVVSDDIILGKPKDVNDAYDMLKKLSNRTHFVATAICLINTRTYKTVKDIDISYVTFSKLSDVEILNYIEKFNPLDKAGSYGIQDEGFDFAVNIDGEMDNIIGFPIKLFEKMLLLV